VPEGGAFSAYRVPGRDADELRGSTLTPGGAQACRWGRGTVRVARAIRRQASPRLMPTVKVTPLSVASRRSALSWGSVAGAFFHSLRVMFFSGWSFFDNNVLCFSAIDGAVQSRGRGHTAKVEDHSRRCPTAIDGESVAGSSGAVSLGAPSEPRHELG
jgi:hypothetical protein